MGPRESNFGLSTETKIRKGRRSENGRSTEKVELMRTRNLPIINIFFYVIVKIEPVENASGFWPFIDNFEI